MGGPHPEFSLHPLFSIRCPQHIHTEHFTVCAPQRSPVFLPPPHGGRRLPLKPSPHAASASVPEGSAFSRRRAFFTALGSHFFKKKRRESQMCGLAGEAIKAQLETACRVGGRWLPAGNVSGSPAGLRVLASPQKAVFSIRANVAWLLWCH